MKKRVLAPEENRKNVSAEVLEDYMDTLSQMINCKTVFTHNNENKAEFDKFYKILEERFPTLTEKAERLTFGSGCFVYIIRGKNAQKNIMLMSHHDVVDGSEDWNTEPFCATVKDGSMYGRGTIDTKTPLFAELQACEELLKENFSFDGINLYIGSSNNEETCGDGMVLATEYFKENGIHFDAVFDEGGAITTGMIPGVKEKSAMIAVHEKSRHMYRCTAKKSQKGHGGLNQTSNNTISQMSAFIQEVENSKIYKGDFSDEVRGTFETHAPYMQFPLNIVMGNMKLFSVVIKKVMQSIPQAKPMLSTSIAFTTISGGSEIDPQIAAQEVVATMFLRCVREDDLYKGLEKIKEIAAKHGVEIEETERDYCHPTDYKTPQFKLLESVINEVFPDVIVSPFLLVAGTDARRFTDVADNIFRFAPIDLDEAQYASVHGANEHIKLQNVGQCVCFYKALIKKYIVF
ncbi:MAG: M20/M25/M40 family metallo-hydrolase [Oscillospiraceae bacterium]|nr:M20/M25/M40 family metallo-hydrolase [Oscillospiraceae bacterium]